MARLGERRAITSRGTAPWFRRLAVTAAAAATLIALPACSQGQRRHLADEVAHAADRAPANVVSGTLVVSLRPARLIQPALGAQLRAGTLASVGVLLDVHAKRSALIADNQPLALFEENTIYARRITKSVADKRLWARLELDRLPTTSTPKFVDVIRGASPGDVVVVGPVFLTDLLAGVLTGSVNQRRVDPDGNRLITFNTSISKADRKNRTNDDDRKARKNMLKSLAISGDVHSGEVVLRKDGSVARLRIVFGERPDNQTRLDLEAELTCDAGPAPVPAAAQALTTPARESTVRVPELGGLKAVINDHLQPQGPPTMQAAPPVPVATPPTSVAK